jgi:hypothetical protein
MRSEKDEMRETYQKIADSCICGLCNKEDATRMSEYTCTVCGRILCEGCWLRWGVCKDHHITCCGEEVIGQTKWNYTCKKCGNGVGSLPDPYYKWLDQQEE